MSLLVDDIVSFRVQLLLPTIPAAASAPAPHAATVAYDIRRSPSAPPPAASARAAEKGEYTAVAAAQCEVGDALDDLVAESAALYVAGVQPLLVSGMSVDWSVDRAAAPTLESLARAALSEWRSHTSTRTLHGAAAVFAAAEEVAIAARAGKSDSAWADAVHGDALRSLLTLAWHVTTNVPSSRINGLLFKGARVPRDSMLWVLRAFEAASHAGAIFPVGTDILRHAVTSLVDCDTGFSVPTSLRLRELLAVDDFVNSRGRKIEQYPVVGDRSCSLPLKGARERLLSATSFISRAQLDSNHRVSGLAIGSIILATAVLLRTCNSQCGVCGCARQVDECGDRVCWCDACIAAGGCRVDSNYEETVTASLSRLARTGSVRTESSVQWCPREHSFVPDYFRKSVFEGTADAHEAASNALEAACMEDELSKIAELLDADLACRGDFLGAAVTRLLGVAAASVLRRVEIAPLDRSARRAISAALMRAAIREANFAAYDACARWNECSSDEKWPDAEEALHHALTLAAQEAVRRFCPSGPNFVCDAVAARFAPVLYSKEDFSGGDIPRPLVAYVFETPHRSCREGGVLLSLYADGWLLPLLRTQLGTRLVTARQCARHLVGLLRALGTAAGMLDALVVALHFHSANEDGLSELLSLIEDVSAHLAASPPKSERIGELTHAVVSALERFNCDDFDLLAKLASVALALSRHMPPTPENCFFTFARMSSATPFDVTAIVTAKAVELRRAFVNAMQRSPSVTRRFDHQTALDYFTIVHLWIRGHLDAACFERSDWSEGIETAAFAARFFYPWLRSRVPAGSDDTARRAAQDADNRAVVDRIRTVFVALQHAGLDDEPVLTAVPRPSPEDIFSAFTALACNLNADVFLLADRARAARAGTRARAIAARLSHAAFKVMLATAPTAFLRGSSYSPCAVCGCLREVDASGDRICMCDACAVVGGCHGHASYSDVHRDFSYSRAKNVIASVGRPRARSIIELAVVLRAAQNFDASGAVEEDVLVAAVSRYALEFVPRLNEKAAERGAWDVAAALCRSLCLLHRDGVDGGVSLDLSRDLLRLAMSALPLPSSPLDSVPASPKNAFPDVQMQVVDEKRKAVKLSTRELRVCSRAVLDGLPFSFSSLSARLSESILAVEFESLSILVEPAPSTTSPIRIAVAASPCDDDDPRHGELACHEVAGPDPRSGIMLVQENGLFPERGSSQAPISPVHYHDTVAAGGLWTRVGVVDVESQWAALLPGAPRWVTVLRAADLRALGASPTWPLRQFLLTPVSGVKKSLRDDVAILGVRVQTRAINRGPLASAVERAAAAAVALRVTYATNDVDSAVPPCLSNRDSKSACRCPPNSAAARVCEAACSTFLAVSARKGYLPLSVLDALLGRACALGAVEPLVAAVTALLLGPTSSDVSCCRSRRCLMWLRRALESALPSGVDSALRGALSFSALASSTVARSLAASLESEHPVAADACVLALESVLRGCATGILPRGVCVALPPSFSFGGNAGAPSSIETSLVDSQHADESDLDLPSLEATSAHDSSFDSDALPSVLNGAVDGQVGVVATPVAIVIQWPDDDGGAALVQLEDGGRTLVPAALLQPARAVSIRVYNIVLQALATAHARAHALADTGLAAAALRALLLGGSTGREFLGESLSPAQARAFLTASIVSSAPSLPPIPPSPKSESLVETAANLPQLNLDEDAAALETPASSPIDLHTLGWSLAADWHIAGRRGKMGVALSGSSESSVRVSFRVLGEKSLSLDCAPVRLLTLSECIEVVVNSNSARPLVGVAVLLHTEKLWARPPTAPEESSSPSLRDDDSLSSHSDSSSSDELSRAARDTARSASIASLAFDADRIRSWGGVPVISLPNAHARCRRALRASSSFRACILLDTASARLLWASVLDWRAWGSSLAVGSRVDALLPVGLGWAKATIITAAPEPFRGWFRVAFDSLGADWRVWCPWEIDRIIFGDLTIAPEGWVTGNVSIRSRRRFVTSPHHKVHSPPAALALATGSAAASYGGAAVDAATSDDDQPVGGNVSMKDDVSDDGGVRATLAPSVEALQSALDDWRMQLAPATSVCALDKQGKWFEAIVLERRDVPRENDAAQFSILTIRFVGWSPSSDVAKYDEHFVLPGDAHRLLPPRTKIRDWRRVQVGDEVEQRSDRLVEPALVLAVDVTRGAVVISPIPVPRELLNASTAAASCVEGDAVSKWSEAVRNEGAAALATQWEWISLRNSSRIAAHATHRRPRAWADIDTENHSRGAAGDVMKPPAAALAPVEPRLRHVQTAFSPATNAAPPPLPPTPRRLSQLFIAHPPPSIIRTTALAPPPAPALLTLQSSSAKDAMRTLLTLLRLDGTDVPVVSGDAPSAVLNAIMAGTLKRTITPVTVEPRKASRSESTEPARVCLWPRGASVGRVSPFPAAVVSLSNDAESSTMVCAGGPVREDATLAAECAWHVTSPDAAPLAAQKWDGVSLTFSAWLRAPIGATGVILHQPPSAPVHGDVVARPPRLPIGLPVVARFAPHDSGSWYRGIVSNMTDGKFDIAYEDGDASAKIERERIELREDAAQSLTLVLSADGLLEASLVTLPLAKAPSFEGKPPPSSSVATESSAPLPALVALSSLRNANEALSDTTTAMLHEESDEEDAALSSPPTLASRSLSSGNLLDEVASSLPRSREQPAPGSLMAAGADLNATSARGRAVEPVPADARSIHAQYPLDRMNRWQRSSASRARPSVSPPSSGTKIPTRRKVCIRSTSRITGADWVHVALTVAPGIMALYVNGVREALVELSPSIETHSRSSSVSIAGSMLTALTDYRTPTARPGFAYLFHPTPSLSMPSAELTRWAPRELDIARASLWPCWLAGPAILETILSPPRVDNLEVLHVANRGKSGAMVDCGKELDSDEVWNARAEVIFRATESKRAEIDELCLLTERIIRDEDSVAGIATGFPDVDPSSLSSSTSPAFCAVPRVLQPLLRGLSAKIEGRVARKSEKEHAVQSRAPSQRVRHTLLADGNILFVDVYGARLAARVLNVLSGDMVNLVILPNANAGALAGTCVKADARDLYVPCAEAELSTPPPPPLLPSRSRTAPTTPLHSALHATSGGGSSGGGAPSVGIGSGSGVATPPRSARGGVDAMIASTSPLRGTTPRRKPVTSGHWLSVAQAQAVIDVAEASSAEAGAVADAEPVAASSGLDGGPADGSADAPLARTLLRRALKDSTPITDASAAEALVRSICADGAISCAQAANVVLEAMPSEEHATAISCALLRAALGVLASALSHTDETQTSDSKAVDLNEVAAWVCAISQRTKKNHAPRREEEFIALAVFAAIVFRGHRWATLPARALSALVCAAGSALNAVALEPSDWKNETLARAAAALTPALEEGVAALAVSLQHVSCSLSTYVSIPRDRSPQDDPPRRVPASRDSSVSRAAMFTAACADAAARREASAWPPQLPPMTISDALASKATRDGLSAVNIGGVYFLSCAWPANCEPRPPPPRLLTIPVNPGRSAEPHTRANVLPPSSLAGTLDLLFSESDIAASRTADAREPVRSGLWEEGSPRIVRSTRLEEAILETLHSIAEHDRITPASSNHMSRRLAPAAFVAAATDALLLGAKETRGPFFRPLQHARRSVWSALVLHDLSRLHSAALYKSTLSPAVDAAVRAAIEDNLGRPSPSTLAHGSKPREGRFLFRLFDSQDREQKAAAAALWHRVKASAREVAAQAGEARPRSKDRDARVGQLLTFNAGVIHALPMLTVGPGTGIFGCAARVTGSIISSEMEHVFFPFVRDAVLRAAVELSATCSGSPTESAAATYQAAGNPTRPPFAAAISNAVIDALPRYTRKLFGSLVDGSQPPPASGAAPAPTVTAAGIAQTPASPPISARDTLEGIAEGAEGVINFTAALAGFRMPEPDSPLDGSPRSAPGGAAVNAEGSLSIALVLPSPPAPTGRACDRCTFSGSSSSICELCGWVVGEALSVSSHSVVPTVSSPRSPPPLPPPADVERPQSRRLAIGNPRSLRQSLPPPVLTIDSLGPLRFAAFQSFMLGFGGEAGPHVGGPRPLRSAFIVRLQRRPGLGHAEGRVQLLPQFRRALAHVPASQLRTRGRPFRIVFAHEGGIDAGGLFSEGLTSAAEELSGDAANASTSVLSAIGARHALPADLPSRASALVAAVSAGELLGIAVRAEHPVPLTLPRAAWRAALGDRAAAERRPLARALGVGLERVLPLTLLRIAGARALADAVGGARDLDVSALRAKARYRGWGRVAGVECPHDVSESHPTVRAFWSVLDSLSRRELELVMRFTFARRRLSPTNLPTLTLERMARDDPDGSLPAGHTCGSVLELPEYSNEATLKRQLLKAAESCIEYDLDGGTQSD